jgi:large subunit ribosomal protein L30e
MIVMDLDLNKVLRNVMQTGQVFIGSNQTIKVVDNHQAKAVVLANNCPADVRKRISGKVPVIDFPGMGVDLGITCGKPFAIASIAIIEPGESDILLMLKE